MLVSNRILIILLLHYIFNIHTTKWGYPSMKKIKKGIFKMMFAMSMAVMLSAVPAFSNAETTQTQGSGSIASQLSSAANGLVGATSETGTVTPKAAAAPTEQTKAGTDVVLGEPQSFTITTAEELKEHLGNGQSSKYVTEYGSSPEMTYRLGGSIEWTHGNFEPVDAFYGTFDGGGNIISNLVITPAANNNELGGFVLKLAQGATITNVIFDNCRVSASKTVGTVAAQSYGKIDTVKVTNGKVVVTAAGTTKSLIGGGLVGTFDVKDKSDENKDTLPTGSISTALYSGSIVGTASGNDVTIPEANQANIGGLIGNLASNDAPNALSNLYWDMSKAGSITDPVGNKDGIVGAAGIKMATETTLTLGTDTKTKNVNELVTVIPSNKNILDDKNITWELDDNEAGCVSLENNVINGVDVGTATLVCNINVGDTSLVITCAITVEGDKKVLAEQLELAKYYNELSTANKEHFDRFDPGLLTALADALSTGQSVYDNTGSTTQTISDTVTLVKGVNDRLLAADKKLLQEKADKAKEILDKESAFYASMAELSTVRDSALTLISNPVATSIDVRTRIGEIDIAINNLRLLLRDMTIRRVESGASYQVEITIPGFVKEGADGNKIGISGSAKAISVSKGTSGKTEPVNINSANVDTHTGVMTITLLKSAIGVEAYNLETIYNVTIEDTVSVGGENRTLKSKETPVILERKPNHVKDNVKYNEPLGYIEQGSTYSDLNVKGIPVTYNPKTGAEDNSTAEGKVISWEWDKDAEIVNSIEAQSWDTTGVKYIKGIIADPADKSYVNPDGKFYVTGTVEVTNKTALAALLNQAKGYDKNDYTEESWPAFGVAFEQASAVNTNKTVSQKQIDDAVAALDAAMKGLKSRPTILLKQQSVNLRINDIFEPLLYVEKLTDVIDVPEESDDPNENVLFSKLVVTTNVKDENGTEYQQIVYKDGAMVEPLDTSAASSYEVTYSITNSSGINSTAKLTVNVFGQGSSSDNTDNNGNGDGGEGVVKGDNTVTDGTVILEFVGTDLFTEDEIKAGAKLIVVTTKVEDHSNILAILEKLASVLKGQVTIDGVYDISLYKEVEGTRTKLTNSQIKNFVSLHLPISQQAIDSKDYAVIHALDNGGYDIYKGSIKETDGVQYIVVRTKSFSEYAVVYGGGISTVADTMDTSDKVDNQGGNSGNNDGAADGTGNGTADGTGATGQGGADTDGSTDNSTDATGQGGADTDNGGTSVVSTGDTTMIIAIVVTLVVSVAAIAGIMIKKRQANK